MSAQQKVIDELLEIRSENRETIAALRADVAEMTHALCAVLRGDSDAKGKVVAALGYKSLGPATAEAIRKAKEATDAK